MTSTEEPSGTVLHRLIQEQLRYGNPTDTRTLLAIQQQALRGGSGSGSGSGPSSGGDTARSPRSSLESLTQEDLQYPQLSARQEPQGQEHQADYQHSERSYQLYQLHGEELPTYEQAKAHSQYLASHHWAPAAQVAVAGPLKELHEGAYLHEGDFHAEADAAEVKRGHARSLSERRMQMTLERSHVEAKAEAMKSSSHSYPELFYYHPQAPQQSAGLTQDQRCPPPEYSAPTQGQGQGFIPQEQEPLHRYTEGVCVCVRACARACVRVCQSLILFSPSSATHDWRHCVTYRCCVCLFYFLSIWASTADCLPEGVIASRSA